jgi:6-pyruvoyltetrahydropterin/6-carboxytetrahydropterin synthase
MFRLTVKDSFSAAHRLENYHGKCEELHGHNFLVEATFQGEALNQEGMLIDFKTLKGYLTSVLDALDHKYVNEIPFFRERASSSEYMAMYIFDELTRLVPDKAVSLQEVKVWESERSCAAYGA